MRTTFGGRRYNFDWRGFITPGVKLLVLICSGVFLFQTLVSLVADPRAEFHYIIQIFGLIPSAFTRGLRIWQPFTYIFLHGGLFHLLINMLMLWMFGRELELLWGKKRFLNYFFICGVGAGLIEDLTGWVEEDHQGLGPPDVVDSVRDRLRPHDHPGPAPVGRVVDAAMPTDPPLPEVVRPDGGDPALLDPPGDARGERPRDHLGEQRQDVDLERHDTVFRREPARRRGALGRGPPPSAARRDPAGARSNATVSTTISPRRGAKIRTKSRTPGTSNSPYGPPSTM